MITDLKLQCVKSGGRPGVYFTKHSIILTPISNLKDLLQQCNEEETLRNFIVGKGIGKDICYKAVDNLDLIVEIENKDIVKHVLDAVLSVKNEFQGEVEKITVDDCIDMLTKKRYLSQEESENYKLRFKESSKQYQELKK